MLSEDVCLSAEDGTKEQEDGGTQFNALILGEQPAVGMMDGSSSESVPKVFLTADRRWVMSQCKA